MNVERAMASSGRLLRKEIRSILMASGQWLHCLKILLSIRVARMADSGISHWIYYPQI